MSTCASTARSCTSTSTRRRRFKTPSSPKSWLSQPLRPPKAATKRSDLGSEIRPLVLKYTVPADAQIELWDSAIRVRAKGGDTIDAVASRYGVPGWAIAQINSLDQDHPLEVGQELIVPRSIYSEAALQEPVQPSPRKPPRPTTSVSSIRPAPSAREPAATTEPPPPPPAADTFSDRWRVPPTQ